MGSRPCDWKIANVVRAKRAGEKAGYKNPIIEIRPDSTIRIIPTTDEPKMDGDEWDGVR
jgi:hypothetical protein